MVFKEAIETGNRLGYSIVRDLACHVIGLNAGCLWVTPSAIPGLHSMTSLLVHAVAQPTKRIFLPKNLYQLFLRLDLRSLDHKLTKIGLNFRKQTTSKK